MMLVVTVDVSSQVLGPDPSNGDPAHTVLPPKPGGWAVIDPRDPVGSAKGLIALSHGLGHANRNLGERLDNCV